MLLLLTALGSGAEKPREQLPSIDVTGWHAPHLRDLFRRCERHSWFVQLGEKVFSPALGLNAWETPAADLERETRVVLQTLGEMNSLRKDIRESKESFMQVEGVVAQVSSVPQQGGGGGRHVGFDLQGGGGSKGSSPPPPRATSTRRSSSARFMPSVVAVYAAADVDEEEEEEEGEEEDDEEDADELAELHERLVDVTNELVQERRKTQSLQSTCDQQREKLIAAQNLKKMQLFTRFGKFNANARRYNDDDSDEEEGESSDAGVASAAPHTPPMRSDAPPEPTGTPVVTLPHGSQPRRPGFTGGAPCLHTTPGALLLGGIPLPLLSKIGISQGSVSNCARVCLV